MDLQNKKILTFAEGCQLLGFSKSYVYKMVETGILPHSKPNLKKIFFEREKLEKFLLRNSHDGIVEREEKVTCNTKKGGENG